ncbi:hypothetical protein ALC57_17309 [Trachymyrmex cornetzi]|uniref:Mutator-like transposase domain-containing protein n=1 Tax=Trachymyrmex cornetzi TaxID=471704 RepID=A0A195DCZ2_9HYME|nr:hypothetical protein ALC57_17309 [Trachymyrmex cornetzi]
MLCRCDRRDIHSGPLIDINGYEVNQEKKKNEEQGKSICNLKMSGDSSWKKRSFESLYGVTTLIGYYSGKIIDLIVKSSYCQDCTFWKNKHFTQEYCECYADHEEECTINHKFGGKEKLTDTLIKKIHFLLWLNYLKKCEQC